MPELEPITREEKLLNGEDLTPITRKEKFIKRIYDKTQEIPEPITREEMFLKKAGEGSGGDVTIEQLNVSENGTYSESGKAYSPVVVNVPQTTLTTLDVTENGTYTAPSGTAYDEVDVNVSLPENAYLLEEYEDVPTDIASFTASDAPLKSLTASIVPVQDLHGYDSPWAGGAGKNKLPMTVDGIKSANTSGTWSGNSYVINGVTFTIQTDSDGNVIGIDAHGLASANATLDLNLSVNFNASIVMTGCPSGGSDSTYEMLTTSGNHRDRGTGAEWTWDTNNVVRIVIRNSYNASHVVFKPMIRLASVTDATFEPYSNECPISGWTEEVVTRCGKNLFDKDNFKFIANGYIDGNSLQWTGSKTIREYPADSLGNYWNSPLIDVTPLKEKTITYSGFKSESGVARGVVDENFNVLTASGTSGVASRTVDLSQYPTAKYLVLSFVKSNYNFDNAQLEIGSSASTYEPYAGTTTTIPFTDGQGQSHTSYGGQIDVISGKEDDTYGIYQKTNFALPTTKDNKNRWEFGTDLPDVLSDLIGSMTRATTDYDLMCNNMTIKLESSASVGETTCSLYGHSNRVEWRIRISDEYTAEEAQAIANASVIRYPINIVTLQQQPTSIKSLDGDNNVFASTGQIENLEFFAKEA